MKKRRAEKALPKNGPTKRVGSGRRGSPRRRYWVCYHETGGIWPLSLSFWKNTAIRKLRDHYNKHGWRLTWRQLRRRGFRVVAVHLSLANAVHEPRP
jgi:hypothetical protein